MSEINVCRVEWRLKERLRDLNDKSHLNYTQADIAYDTGIKYNTLNSYFNNCKGGLNMRRLGLIIWWFRSKGLSVDAGDLIQVVK